MQTQYMELDTVPPRDEPWWQDPGLLTKVGFEPGSPIIRLRKIVGKRYVNCHCQPWLPIELLYPRRCIPYIYIYAYTTACKPVILPPDLKTCFSYWVTTHCYPLVQVNFILLGSFLLAFAIEEVGLHHRLALKLLSMVPGDPKAWGNRWLPCQKAGGRSKA